jgi:hypothetical protein
MARINRNDRESVSWVWNYVVRDSLSMRFFKCAGRALPKEYAYAFPSGWAATSLDPLICCGGRSLDYGVDSV